VGGAVEPDYLESVGSSGWKHGSSSCHAVVDTAVLGEPVVASSWSFDPIDLSLLVLGAIFALAKGVEEAVVLH